MIRLLSLLCFVAHALLCGERSAADLWACDAGYVRESVGSHGRLGSEERALGMYSHALRPEERALGMYSHVLDPEERALMVAKDVDCPQQVLYAYPVPITVVAHTQQPSTSGRVVESVVHMRPTVEHVQLRTGNKFGGSIEVMIPTAVKILRKDTPIVVRRKTMFKTFEMKIFFEYASGQVHCRAAPLHENSRSWSVKQSIYARTESSGTLCQTQAFCEILNGRKILKIVYKSAGIQRNIFIDFNAKGDKLRGLVAGDIHGMAVWEKLWRSRNIKHDDRSNGEKSAWSLVRSSGLSCISEVPFTSHTYRKPPSSFFSRAWV